MNVLRSFANPWFLAILVVALPFVYMLSRRSLAGLGKTRRIASIAIRMCIVALLVLALAETRILWKNDRLGVIFLIDRSASVPAEYQRSALEFARLASEYRQRGAQDDADLVGCVVFGRNAGIEALPKADELFKEGQDFSIVIERDVTDLQGAIRLAMAAFPEYTAKRIVLVSDGNENRGRALDEARAAFDEGVSIDVLSIRYDYPAEILVDKVVVDNEVHEGEPFDVRIVVESTNETEATLRLFENGSRVSAERVQLKPGKNVFTVPRRIDNPNQSAFDYDVLVEPIRKEDDALAQNNRGHGFTFIRGIPKVLFCSSELELDADIIKALRDERLIVEAFEPAALPGEVSSYLQYSALIFSDVAAHELTVERMRLFESLVKGAGIGFVMIGGVNSFGAGGYLGTPVEELLPVSMDAKHKKSLPNGALAIIMHSCEINNGNYWARATAQQAIQVLSPEDYCGVLYYGGMGGERWLFPILQCNKKAYMRSRLDRFNVGDMPDFARIFDMAHDALSKTEAAIKHIIVFSDGDPNMPSDAKLRQIRADGITTSTICMGWHTTPTNMQRLASIGGGNFYTLTGPNSLPEIFIREAVTVRKALIQERDFRPVVERRGNFLRGVDLSTVPALRGYVITTAKEPADHYLKAPPTEGDLVLDPILSSWQYGLGRSIAFTSDAGRRWAGAWASWSEFQRFWGQAVRWVSKKHSDDRFRVTNTKDGDREIVYIDAIDSDGSFIDDIEFGARVVSPGPDYESKEVEVRQVGRGRYELSFDLSKRGNYLVSLDYSRDGEKQVYTTGVVNPYSPEYRNRETNDVLLQRLADVTGGMRLDDLESHEERARAVFRREFLISRTPQDIWRDLLQLAALLFFVDVFVRRVIVDYAKLYRDGKAKALALLGRKAPREEERSEHLGALLRKKAEVAQSRTESRPTFYTPGESGESADDGEDVSFDAGAQLAAEPRDRSAEAERARQSKKKAEKEQEESGYTSRLLAAKRRALKDRKDDEPS